MLQYYKFGQWQYMMVKGSNWLCFESSYSLTSLSFLKILSVVFNCPFSLAVQFNILLSWGLVLIFDVMLYYGASNLKRMAYLWLPCHPSQSPSFNPMELFRMYCLLLLNIVGYEFCVFPCYRIGLKIGKTVNYFT